MADKKRIKRSIKQLQRVKTWQLIVLLILFGVLAATFLRLNNIGMVERRTAVLSADKGGDGTALVNDIFALQRWSAAHMNAGTGPFYLEASYDRAVKSTVQATANDTSISDEAAAARKAADAVCQKRFSGYGVGYSQCFAAEFQKAAPVHGNELPQVQLPSPELYRHEFISPDWSPDFAGWSIVACLGITLVIVTRFISLIILKTLLRKHYDTI